MRLQIAIFVALLLLMTTVRAEDVLHGKIKAIEAGEVAEYSGFLVDDSQMKHFRQINEEKKLLEQKTIKLEELGIRMEDSKNWYQDNYYKIKDKYEWQQTKSFWVNTLFFVGGVVLTGLITYGAMKTVDKR